jgi:sporulation protein YlmC with PRC-barrel domain
MKGVVKIAMILVAAAILGSLGNTESQVAGSANLGVAKTEMKAVMVGWSAEKDVLGHPVYNDHGEKIGTIDDNIVAPDKAVSYAIVGAGGLLGIGKHDVAIPASQIRREGERYVLPGAMQKLPEFEYANKRSDSGVPIRGPQLLVHRADETAR